MEDKKSDSKENEEKAFQFWLLDSPWEHSHDLTFKNRLTGETKTVKELRGIFKQQIK